MLQCMGLATVPNDLGRYRVLSAINTSAGGEFRVVGSSCRCACVVGVPGQVKALWLMA